MLFAAPSPFLANLDSMGFLLSRGNPGIHSPLVRIYIKPLFSTAIAPKGQASEAAKNNSAGTA